MILLLRMVYSLIHARFFDFLCLFVNMKIPVLLQISSSAFGHQVLDYEQVLFNISRLRQICFPVMYQSRYSANKYLLEKIKAEHLVLPHFPSWLVHRALLRLSKRYRSLSKELSQSDCTYLKEIHRLPACRIAEQMKLQFSQNNIVSPIALNKQKIIGVVLRDHGYESIRGVNHKKHASRHRNAQIISFVPTLKILKSNNFEIIRFGRHNLESVELNKIVYNLSHFSSTISEDSLDFQLAEMCDFFISTASGPDVLSLFFRKPLYLVDTTFPVMPRTELVRSFLVKDYYLSKGETSVRLKYQEISELHQNHMNFYSLLTSGQVFTESKSELCIRNFVKSQILNEEVLEPVEYEEVEPGIFY